MVTSQIASSSIRIQGETLDELLLLISTMEKFTRQDKDNQLKIETLKRFIDMAKESIARAEEKRNALQNINLVFKNRLDKRKQAIEEARDAWIHDLGIDVRQVSSDQDNFRHYEFTYSKLPIPKRLQKQINNNPDITSNLVLSDNGDNNNERSNNQSAPIMSEFNFVYKVGLKHSNNTLTIVSQEPEILKDEEITKFNEDLTKTCICPDTNDVDYKLAVLKIKRGVIKNP